MRVAVWSRVASKIKEKFGITWEAAKTAYKKLRDSEDRKPSIRMVQALPERLPARLKETPKRTNPPKPKQTPKAAFPRLPPGVNYPPPPIERPKGKPKRVPWNQKKARNYFEEQLLERGLPVKAIGQSTIGQEVAATAETKAIQKSIAAALAKGYREIKKNGAMEKKTKDRVHDLMVELFGDDDALAAWHGILRNLYGINTKPVSTGE